MGQECGKRLEAAEGAKWLPCVTVLKSDPYNDPEPAIMEFRLTYEGRLLGATANDTRVRQKHEIRRKFHVQLRRLWEVNPYLKSGTPVMSYSMPGSGPRATKTLHSYEHGKTMVEFVASKYPMFGYRFVPLVREELSLICSIHILFLRPDRPGSVLKSGDIDNRIKVLFDALRLPRDKGELGGYDAPGDGEDPFFVLLEDDSLITHVSVETDMLLEPTGEQFDANDTRLIISVKIRPYDINTANEKFG